MISLKNYLSPAQDDSLPYCFQSNFHGFVLNYWLREFPLSANANRFELRCQSNATDAIDHFHNDINSFEILP